MRLIYVELHSSNLRNYFTTGMGKVALSALCRLAYRLSINTAYAIFSVALLLRPTYRKTRISNENFENWNIFCHNGKLVWYLKIISTIIVLTLTMGLKKENLINIHLIVPDGKTSYSFVRNKSMEVLQLYPLFIDFK